jgi:hypothetical protein
MTGGIEEIDPVETEGPEGAIIDADSPSGESRRVEGKYTSVLGSG